MAVQTGRTVRPFGARRHADNLGSRPDERTPDPPTDIAEAVSKADAHPEAAAARGDP